MIPIPQFVFRRLAKFLIDYPHITKRLYERAQRTPYSHISGRDGQGEYMRRYWLFNPYETADGQPIKRNWFMRMLPSIRFHDILRPDDDEHLHDHPWDAQTIVLRGWYIEEVENPEFDKDDSYRSGLPEKFAFVREAGYTGPIGFGQYHRIAQVSQSRRQQTLTLFITFKYRGQWGFKVNGVKVLWHQYLAARRQGVSPDLLTRTPEQIAEGYLKGAKHLAANSRPREASFAATIHKVNVVNVVEGMTKGGFTAPFTPIVPNALYDCDKEKSVIQTGKGALDELLAEPLIDDLNTMADGWPGRHRDPTNWSE